MIIYINGNIFNHNADILINPVNCVGVMGKGLALQFKNLYPDMFKEYVDICNKKEIEPDKPFIWETINDDNKTTIINLPTKIHWRDPSTYSIIEMNLKWLKEYLEPMDKNTTVSLTPLGCGCGGLDWKIVKALIQNKLKDINATILVFEPKIKNKDIKQRVNMVNSTDIKSKDVKSVKKER